MTSLYSFLFDRAVIISLYYLVSTVLLLKDSCCIFSIFLFRVPRVRFWEQRSTGIVIWIDGSISMHINLNHLATAICSLKMEKRWKIYYKLFGLSCKCNCQMQKGNYNNEDFKVHHGSDIPNDKHSLISKIRKEPLCKN